MIHLDIQVRRPFIPFVCTLHDYETSAWNFKPRSLFRNDDGLLNKVGYPEIVPLLNRDGTDMTEEIQFLWFNQNGLNMTLDERKQSWASLTSGHRAFTNNAGTDTRADFIRRVNLEEDLPVLFELSCGGNVFELDSLEVFSLMEENYYRVKTLDPLKVSQYSEWNRNTHPQFFHLATNSTPFGFDGEVSETPPWRVDAFPQFNGRVVVPIFSANGINYVRTNRVKIMSPTDIFPPHPYNP